MTRQRQLEITTTAPADEDDILITGILAQVANGFKAIDNQKLNHMALIFVSGMIVSFLMFGMVYIFVRRSSGASVDSAEATEMTEFGALPAHEPFIE